MKIKVSEATPRQLDWMVAKCEGLLGPDGIRLSDEYCDSLRHDQDGDFTNDWAQGGPIIEREKIDTFNQNNGYTGAIKMPTKNDPHPTPYFGTTTLIAAMRCYVASKLGDEIEIPEELQ